MSSVYCKQYIQNCRQLLNNYLCKRSLRFPIYELTNLTATSTAISYLYEKYSLNALIAADSNKAAEEVVGSCFPTSQESQNYSQVTFCATFKLPTFLTLLPALVTTWVIHFGMDENNSLTFYGLYNTTLRKTSQNAFPNSLWFNTILYQLTLKLPCSGPLNRAGYSHGLLY